MVAPEAGSRGRAVSHGRLWFGLLGGPIAWLLHLLASYWAVPRVCESEGHGLLHLLTALGAMVAGAAVLTAAGVHRGNGDATNRAVAAGVGTHRFLGMIGRLVSGFFLVLILVEGLPAVLDRDPCAAPTLDRPIIMLAVPPTVTPAPGPLHLAAPRSVAADFPGTGAAHPDRPASPGNWWRAWNTDGRLLVGMLLLTGLYLRGVRRLWERAGEGRGISRWRVASYLSGMGGLFTALVSPIDALGEALFSAHMVQHMLLMVVAAPLLVLGQPIVAYLWALSPRGRRALAASWRDARVARSAWRAVSNPVAIFGLHVGALWVWHVPALYEGALDDRALHALEHASFLITAMLFWWALTRTGRMGRWHGFGAAILYVFGTALQSGALGALLLFASAPWYRAHQEGATTWGVDLLVDQQLAGALMWIPAGLVYGAAMLVLFLAWLRQADRTIVRRERLGWNLQR